MTRVDRESGYWRAIASTDPQDGTYPTGLTLDLWTSYCRRTVQEGVLALHDAPNQGWATDPAFETHGLHCYHGTTIRIDGEPYGTVCFVSEEPRTEQFSAEETMFAELLTRMLEHELREQRTAAKIARLDQFATIVSHDLRNPLNVAHGRLGLERAERLAVDDRVDRTVSRPRIVGVGAFGT